MFNWSEKSEKSSVADSVKFVNKIDLRVASITPRQAKEGHIVFDIKLYGPYDIPFTFTDRFSSISDFQQKVTSQLGVAPDKLPAFPSKKFFGATDPVFLQKRSQELTVYLNGFLAHPQIKQSPLVYGYFRSKATGEGSQETIDKFIAFLCGKQELELPTVEQLVISWFNRNLLEPARSYLNSTTL